MSYFEDLFKDFMDGVDRDDYDELGINDKPEDNTFCIGDIHGNIDALEAVISVLPYDEDDTLIFLGDYGDGFPGTSQVIDKLLGLSKECKCIFLQGNHDYWVRDWFNSGLRPTIWTEQGGQATIESYIGSGKMTNKEHVYFWNNLKPYYKKDKNLYVHGGWDAQSPFEEVCKEKMNNGHLEIHWDRSLNEGTPGKYAKKFNNIFIGHTATKDHKPFQNKNVWNLDTGAGWDGKLTIMDVDTKWYWQSKKNEKSGR